MVKMYQAFTKLRWDKRSTFFPTCEKIYFVKMFIFCVLRYIVFISVTIILINAIDNWCQKLWWKTKEKKRNTLNGPFVVSPSFLWNTVRRSFYSQKQPKHVGCQFCTLPLSVLLETSHFICNQHFHHDAIEANSQISPAQHVAFTVSLMWSESFLRIHFIKVYFCEDCISNVIYETIY